MPDHTDVVAAVKADLIARGVNLSGPCGAFEITKRVFWQLRAEGWGYVAAPAGGENCNGFRTDKGVTMSGSFVDCIGDAGGANTPTWQFRAATPDEVAMFRPLVDPGDVVAPVPPVPPPPTPAPATDLAAFAAELFGELEKIYDGLVDLTTAINTLNGNMATVAKTGVKVHL